MSFFMSYVMFLIILPRELNHWNVILQPTCLILLVSVNPKIPGLTYIIYTSVCAFTSQLYNGKQAQKQNNFEKTLPDGPNAILRPLLAVFLAYPKISKLPALYAFSNIYLSGTSGNPNQFLRPLYKWYFCHITIAKWFWNCPRTIRKCVFKDILFSGSIPIVIPNNWQVKGNAEM